MKKTTILFLVLVIILSFASCSTASNEEETTVTEATTIATTLSSEDLMAVNSALEWIDSVFERKSTEVYGGLRPSIAEQINLHIQKKIAENPDEGPSYYAVEYLSHPEGTEGFFQIALNFEATKINQELQYVIEGDNPESHIFIRGYSESQVEEIMASLLRSAESTSEEFHYEIVECDHDYCCLIIYN